MCVKKANMDILKVVSIIIYFITTVKCIKVIDKFVKTGPVVDKYCGKYGACDEGTHVMCRYYDPNNKFGPMCHDPYTNITLNEDQKEFIVAVVNEVRSRVAMGGDKLRDGSMLPQGYGVMSVAWDDELAEFAQLWANQCIEGYDLCRATSKFPDFLLICC
ncbi:venom allergen 3-like [Aricia agestis]|uniref:venom allergen 3-like n=1 Tax=Aricia agestis TaxID=91739 RepID=UPI001C20420B|nr:venom allergen 3-like [Aricia agestis]